MDQDGGQYQKGGRGAVGVSESCQGDVSQAEFTTEH